MRRCYRQLFTVISVAVILVLTACQPQETVLPTLVTLGETPADESAASTPDPADVTPTNDAISTPQITATPEQFLGRYANDPQRRAAISAIHAAPGTASVDIYINNTNFVRGLSFRLDTGRVDLLAGNYRVRVTAQGVSPDTATLASAELSIARGETKFLLFTGTPDSLGLSIFTENAAPLNAGEARLTFIHAVPRSPDAAPSYGGIAIADRLTFGRSSAGLALPTGSTTVGMQDEQQTFASRQMELRERTSYTLFMVGDSATPDTYAFVSYERLVPGRATVRFINMLTDPQAVDIYFDDQRVAANVEVPRSTDRQEINTDQRRLSIYPAGADRASASPLLANVPFSAKAGENISLVIMGSTALPQIAAIPEDLSPVRPEYARFIFVHTLPTVPMVRIGQGSALRDDIPEILYGRFSAPVLMPQGSSLLFWRDFTNRQEGDVVERVDNFIVEAGRTYLYTLTGRTDAPPIVFSDPVGIDESLANIPIDATPSFDQAKIRLVNVIDQFITVNVVIDNNAVPIPLAYGSSSAVLPLPNTTFHINVQAQDTGFTIRADTVSLPSLDTYSLFIYGDVSGLYFLPVQDPDEIGQSSQPSLRMINLTRDQRHFFHMALTAASDPSAPSVAAGIENWLTVPEDVPFAINSIAGNTASGFGFVAPGTQDIMLIDVATSKVAQLIRSFTFVGGQHYDIIAYQYSGTGIPEVRAFVVPYPAR